MALQLREMQPQDYESVIALWRSCEGIGLSEDDSPEGIARFLENNPGLCFVALEGGQLAGAVLCGQDGRRGYLYHLAVRKSHRRNGIGAALVKRCFEGLERVGIRKCHIFVFRENQAAIDFWGHTGWQLRTDLVIMSCWTAA